MILWIVKSVLFTRAMAGKCAPWMSSLVAIARNLDFSSAFNTIIPQHLVNKLAPLGFSTTLCNSILDFLFDWPRLVHVGKNTSLVITLSTGAPQGCVSSPLLMTNEWVTRSTTNHIIRYADDRTVKVEMEQFVDWCGKKQPRPECQRNKGDYRCQQEKSDPSHSAAHQWHIGGGSGGCQVPGGARSRWPLLVPKYCVSES